MLALCMTGCAKCSGDESDVPATPQPTPESSSPGGDTVPVTEDEVVKDGNGGDPALPTVPPETQPPASDEPEDPPELGLPEETPAAPSATAAPSRTAAPHTATARPSARTTPKPTATPAPSAAASPSPTDYGDIELPELP